jgi:hypothetical protein
VVDLNAPVACSQGSRRLALFHPRARQVAAQLTWGRRQLLASVAAVPPLLRCHHPRNGWSVAETLEHLLLVEAPLERFLSGTWVAQATRGALEPERERSLLGPSLQIVGTVAPDRTSPAFVPTGVVANDAALTLLTETRTRLLRTLVKVDGLAWGDALLTLPGFSGTRLNLYQWLVWVSRHEMRHATHIEHLARHVDRQSTSGSHRTDPRLRWPACAPESWEGVLM